MEQEPLTAEHSLHTHALAEYPLSDLFRLRVGLGAHQGAVPSHHAVPAIGGLNVALQFAGKVILHKELVGRISLVVKYNWQRVAWGGSVPPWSVGKDLLSLLTRAQLCIARQAQKSVELLVIFLHLGMHQGGLHLGVHIPHAVPVAQEVILWQHSGVHCHGQHFEGVEVLSAISVAARLPIWKSALKVEESHLEVLVPKALEELVLEPLSFGDGKLRDIRPARLLLGTFSFLHRCPFRRRCRLFRDEALRLDETAALKVVLEVLRCPLPSVRGQIEAYGPWILLPQVRQALGKVACASRSRRLGCRLDRRGRLRRGRLRRRHLGCGAAALEEDLLLHLCAHPAFTGPRATR
mmetsp:Transcript_92489/g.205491  ORF Transcript_92489/g.205491 Transcript_92489/m.205491 type:complete len:351 (-) Transcript_92489:269-1321(-)